MPKRTKFRRPHRVRYDGKAKGAKTVDFGEFGLMAEQGTWLTQQQIEAARIAMTRYMNREGQVWIRIFPHNPQTKKPLAMRQGGGKGNVEGYVATVKKGTIMFEVAGVSREVAVEAFRLASHKLPITCKVVTKESLSVQNYAKN